MSYLFLNHMNMIVYRNNTIKTYFYLKFDHTSTLNIHKHLYKDCINTA
jgi:hypothetical protein